MTVSGGEIGPFLPIEQAAIAQTIEENTEDPTKVKENVAMAYGYYNMASYLSQAAGTLFAGLYINYLHEHFGGRVESYYVHILYLYAFLGLLKLICYVNMTN
jgi:MFS family permease